MPIEFSPPEIVQFRKRNGFAAHDEQARVWMATLGPLELPLPNFEWRRSILVQHDYNHIRTGYDTTARGELLVAAWEVGAQCYRDWRAQALCRSLMALGLARYPSQTMQAYERGRTERLS